MSSKVIKGYNFGGALHHISPSKRTSISIINNGTATRETQNRLRDGRSTTSLKFVLVSKYLRPGKTYDTKVS